MEASIYSGGCSMGLVEKQMGMFDNKQFKFDAVAMGVRDPERLFSFERVASLTRKFGQLLRNPEFAVGPSHGADLTPPTFTAAFDWARSCIFRPSEFIKKEKREHVQRLIMTDFPGLRFSQSNFTSPGHPEFIRSADQRWAKRKFNMALFSFSLYQSRKGVDQAIKNAVELTDDDGVIFILDHVHVDPGGQLFFPPAQRDWDVNLLALDKANMDAGIQHVFAIEQGRPRKVAPGRDLGRLAFNGMRETA